MVVGRLSFLHSSFAILIALVNYSKTAIFFEVPKALFYFLKNKIVFG